MIASSLPSDMDETRMSGMSATLLSLGTRAANELRRGSVREVIVRFVLFDDGHHRNVMLGDFGLGGLAVQANQHLIVHGDEAMILDPGGHKVYSQALVETMSLLGSINLRYIFLSHQDPDIVAAVNGWLMTTDAEAYVPSIWTRFVAHFGLDELVERRLHPIPDEGMCLDLDGVDLVLLPAHFLHSPGNIQVYDPVSKILYSGDLGASLGQRLQAAGRLRGPRALHEGLPPAVHDVERRHAGLGRHGEHARHRGHRPPARRPVRGP